MYIFGFDDMDDYEAAILDRQELEGDDCAHCCYKYHCEDQCMEVEEHYNPNLLI